MTKLSCFKAYDIRGKVPEDLNEELSYAIGRAYASEINPKAVVVNYDVRLESPPLARGLTKGLTEGGADVIDIGLCGIEEVYFQTFNRKVDGGIMFTASRKHKGFNGMKLVREEAHPISGDTGLFAIRDRILNKSFQHQEFVGKVIQDFDKSSYISHLLSYVDKGALRPLKIVANPGNGGAGEIMHLLEQHLPFEIIHINDAPDGNFPNGMPNPLLPENRAVTVEAILKHNADLGLAWDDDFDRCFFFDAKGRFIEGYYLVGLLAEVMLTKKPGAKIIHDPRLMWDTIDQVKKAGGEPIQSKTGHAFIKERMRLENAVYGVEMSAHHYFRDFAYCDSVMISWLLIAELMSITNRPLADLVDERIAAYPCGGEINFKANDVAQSIEHVLNHYWQQNPKFDYIDGVSIEFDDWRLNLRGSNADPLLRLNVESKRNLATVQHRVSEIDSLIGAEV